MNKKVDHNSEHNSKRNGSSSGRAKQPNRDPLVFSISELAGRPQGATEEYTMDIEISLNDPDIKPLSNLKGRMQIMKIDREFNVQLRNMEIDIELQCGKCLENYTQKVRISLAEKQYAVDKPQREFREEIQYVDVKYQTIDIREFLRQEIILHFPLVPVCSTHCPGISLD
ncbi:MAG: YceD family protein [Candidatus Gracilibacteria bacterium]